MKSIASRTVLSGARSQESEYITTKVSLESGDITTEGSQESGDVTTMGSQESGVKIYHY